MTAIGDFCVVIRQWLAVGEDVYPDPLVTSWVRMSEEWMSENLRVKHMIQIDWQDIIEWRVLLPPDWQELDTVRFREGGKPLIYAPRDEYYVPNYDLKGRYTIVGNYLLVGKVDETAGTEIEISYYQSIPPLEDEPNWVMKYYSRLYTVCALWHASMYAIEDSRKDMWQDQTFTFVNDMNRGHILSKASGSLLHSRRRASFG